MTDRFIVALTAGQRDAVLDALEAEVWELPSGELLKRTSLTGSARKAVMFAPSLSHWDAGLIREGLRLSAERADGPNQRTNRLRNVSNKIAHLFGLRRDDGREWY